jgi:hypothetical protein
MAATAVVFYSRCADFNPFTISIWYKVAAESPTTIVYLDKSLALRAS